MTRITPLFFITFLFFASAFHPIYAENKEEKPTMITVQETDFQVDGVGDKSKEFQVIFTHPDGSTDTHGYFGHKGEMFNVTVDNKTSVPITMHWHGLILPNNQDGVPGVTQLLIPPGENKNYHFRLLQSGTYWMHSHEKFQEQNQLSAPLIIYDDEDKYKGLQEIVMYLEDFTYKNPQSIFDQLRQAKMKMHHAMKNGDLNDVQYDAFLTNKKTFQAPEVIAVKRGKKVRIRVINAASSTNFNIDTGKLAATLIAVDGQNILHPVKGHVFPIGIGNRLDLILDIPNTEGAYPIKSLAEGTNKQTGLILKTPQAEARKIASNTDNKTERVDYYGLETKLTGSPSLPVKQIDKRLHYVLGGKMRGYIWTLNNQSWPNITPDEINFGDRVEITYENKTSMSHPMHIHGHIFQVTEVDGKPIKGAMRDTVLVQPFSTVKIQFDAINPGLWVNHCHNLYHLNAGMLTVFEYQHYPKPDFWIKADHKG